jgi:hypothetical protein
LIHYIVFNLSFVSQQKKRQKKTKLTENWKKACLSLGVTGIGYQFERFYTVLMSQMALKQPKVYNITVSFKKIKKYRKSANQKKTDL